MIIKVYLYLNSLYIPKSNKNKSFMVTYIIMPWLESLDHMIISLTPSGFYRYTYTPTIDTYLILTVLSPTIIFFLENININKRL